MMYKRKSLKVPLYPCTIDFVYTSDMQKFRDEYGFENEVNERVAHFCAYPLFYKNCTKERIVMLLNKEEELTHGIIAHEALHATNHALNRIGYQFNPYDDEPICYLLMWLIDELYKFLKENKIKVL